MKEIRRSPICRRRLAKKSHKRYVVGADVAEFAQVPDGALHRINTDARILRFNFGCVTP